MALREAEAGRAEEHRRAQAAQQAATLSEANRRRDFLLVRERVTEAVAREFGSLQVGGRVSKWVSGRVVE